MNLLTRIRKRIVGEDCRKVAPSSSEQGRSGERRKTGEGDGESLRERRHTPSIQVNPILAHQSTRKRVGVLRKSRSTACKIEYPMYVMSIGSLLDRFDESGDDCEATMRVHQTLLSESRLVDVEELPPDATVIFVSHEWLGWDHPDPSGIQFRTLLKVLRRLLRGELDVDMNAFDTMYYKHHFKTKAKDWRRILSDAYVWIDWCSMPQPGAFRSHRYEDPKRYAELKRTGKDAIHSIPGYIELASFVLVLCPEAIHANRTEKIDATKKAATCYRTWRRRGWCLVELFACFLSVRKSFPTLLVRSENGTPAWTSILECLKLAVGHADFTCCDRNHRITTETQRVANEDERTDGVEDGGGGVEGTETNATTHVARSAPSEICPCDRPVVLSILMKLMSRSTTRLFERATDALSENVATDREAQRLQNLGMTVARLHFVFRPGGLRGPIEHYEGDPETLRSFFFGCTTGADDAIDDVDGAIASSYSKSEVEKLKATLRWRETEDDWFDGGGVSILQYACLQRNKPAVRELLTSLSEVSDATTRRELLAARIPPEGIVAVGFPGGGTTLMGAMAFSTPELVSMLLAAGADPYANDAIGQDCLKYAGLFTRCDNTELWLRRFPRWDFGVHGNVVGGLLLGATIFFGSNKLEIFRQLVESGNETCDLKAKPWRGSTLLQCVASNEDADLKLMKYLVTSKEEGGVRDRVHDVNARSVSTSWKFKIVTAVFTFLYKWKISRSALVAMMAEEAGNCALHFAVRRGDLRSVEILVAAGADPRIRTDLGYDAFGVCDRSGPFPDVRRVLERAREKLEGACDLGR